MPSIILLGNKQTALAILYILSQIFAEATRLHSLRQCQSVESVINSCITDLIKVTVCTSTCTYHASVYSDNFIESLNFLTTYTILLLTGFCEQSIDSTNYIITYDMTPSYIRSTATLRCTKGYAAIEPGSAVCGRDGTWNIEYPECQGTYI